MTSYMAKKAEIYADTSAFIAFVDRSDTHHPLFRRLFSDPPRVITTSLVVAEGHAWFLRRYDRTRALQFLALIEDLTLLTVVSVGSNEITAAARVMRKFSDQDLTLADAVGLHLMNALRVKICWSTDFHLGLMGVPLAVDSH
jgi:predicted nucleic acid-binding protein